MIKYLVYKAINSKVFRSITNNSSDSGNLIICEDVSPHVKRIILNNPEKRNSFSYDFMSALDNKLIEIRTDCQTNKSDIRAIILKSSISTFSGGHNLLEFKNGTKESQKAVFEKAISLMNNLENYFVPVIVSVHGAAAAAGCQLVASCDIAVCSHKASFSTPGILAGLFCSTPGVAIGRSIPRKIALEMILTGEAISAQKALSFGLVNHVVPDSEVDMISEKIAGKIASLSSPVIKFGKRVFIEQMKLNKDDAYAYASDAMVENLEYRDCVEGINAFLEKRKPIWTHKK